MSIRPQSERLLEARFVCECRASWDEHPARSRPVPAEGDGRGSARKRSRRAGAEARGGKRHPSD